MSTQQESPLSDNPELIIGLVGVIGADLDRVENELQQALSFNNYKAHSISLIGRLKNNYELQLKELPKFDRYVNRAKCNWIELSKDELKHALMSAGNYFREITRDEGALAKLAIIEILRIRSSAQKPMPSTAYILHSLKTKAEVELLRLIYGDNCIIVAAYSPRAVRVDSLAREIGADRGIADRDRWRAQAETLVDRDAFEYGAPYGQNVRDTFPLADVFIDASSRQHIKDGVSRFISLLLGHNPKRTPTREEFAMFQAYGASLRSSAGRQVGAAIANAEGEILAVGTNEVSKAYGGQYWEGDVPDARDHRRGEDSTDLITRHILEDLIARLKKETWLSEQRLQKSIRDLANEAEELLRKTFQDDDSASLWERAQILQLIEFMRAVHAEMSAILSAAQRGVSTRDSVLYSTTFPCHECAKHIVAAGINRVLFIDPYPKSRVSQLFDDSIVLDAPSRPGRIGFQAFIGIAPRMYTALFSNPSRKIRMRLSAYAELERIYAKELEQILKQKIEEKKLILK